jgi:hypothetical protein
MAPVEINPEIRKVKEKFYGLEWGQMGILSVALVVSIGINFLLPDILGMFKGMVAALFAAPFVFVAIKDFYGLRGLKLVKAIFFARLNARPLQYQSETWKKVRGHHVTSRK